jgi:hypothetical protein
MKEMDDTALPFQKVSLPRRENEIGPSSFILAPQEKIKSCFSTVQVPFL